MIAHTDKSTPEHSLMFHPALEETRQELINSRYCNRQLFEDLTTTLERLIGMTNFLKDAAVLWDESEHYYLRPEPLMHLATSLNLDANDALIMTNGLLKINEKIT